jgi:hypothetical protein
MWSLELGVAMSKDLTVSFDSKYIPEAISGCWLWSGAVDAKGYGRFSVKNKVVKAHRWAYERFIDKIPCGLIVCHKCDVRSCVNPNHLFIGTDLDNSNDKVSKKRHLYGEKHPKAKLNEEQVLFIKNSNLSVKELTTMFNIHRNAVYKIKNNESWSHLNA